MDISINCSICSKKSHAGTTVFPLSCGHSFHRRCIAEYFQNPNGGTEANNKKCPDCKKNTPTTPRKSIIAIVKPRSRLSMMSADEEFPVNDRRPFGALTNTPSPRSNHEVQKINIREFDLTTDTDNGLLDAHTPDSPEFQRIDSSPENTPIPIVQAPQPGSRTLPGKRTFLIDPDVAHLRLEVRLQKFRDRVRAEPVYSPNPNSKTMTK